MAPHRTVVDARVRGGGSIFSGRKYHWWELTLDCGHVVERRIRWTKIDNPRRGWAAQYAPPSLDRLPPEPKHARCELCPED
jgi:hypothetical protein